MSAGKKAKHATETAKGKAKEATGRAVGNESLEMKGRREQMKGGSVLDAETQQYGEASAELIENVIRLPRKSSKR
jgi:uncharacterized protein YjbJ (UPF0337 family)